MAIVKKSELKVMDADALERKLSEIERELHAERAQLKSTGKPSNVGRMQQLKKVCARIKTVLNQRGKKGKEKA